jgi:integrase
MRKLLIQHLFWRPTVGRRSISGGVIAANHNRIQFDFSLDGVRYRPSIKRKPTEANLRRARERLKEIKLHIQAGTFCFAEEFPDFRDLHKVIDPSQALSCNQVFDAFLCHCEARVARNDLSATTLTAYRKILNTSWRPFIGALPFLSIAFSTLIKVADSHQRWGKKTYNNSISVLRRAFAFGYRSHPHALNPAVGLRCVRLSAREQPRPDPFRIQEAEVLIAGIHRDWGESQGNFDELRFFTGLRPSEEIALTIHDFDPIGGTLSVNKARVRGVDRNCTKTRQDRLIHLCPRAIRVIRRQLEVREVLLRHGSLDHDSLFLDENGAPIQNLLCSAHRWRQTLKRLGIRHRKPYSARHTSVSWNLIIGRSPLRTAREHGHSVETMWRVYSAWMEGAVDSDIEIIKYAMENGPQSIPPLTHSASTAQPVLLSTRPQPRRGRIHTRVSPLAAVFGAARAIWHSICH